MYIYIYIHEYSSVDVYSPVVLFEVMPMITHCLLNWGHYLNQLYPKPLTHIRLKSLTSILMLWVVLTKRGLLCAQEVFPCTHFALSVIFFFVRHFRGLHISCIEMVPLYRYSIRKWTITKTDIQNYIRVLAKLTLEAWCVPGTHLSISQLIR